MYWWKQVLGSWYDQQSCFSNENKPLNFEFNKLLASYIKNFFF